MIPIYRNNTWISYKVPSDLERHWSQSLKRQAASFYATAVSKGLSPSQSAVLTECYVNKQLYPGLLYNKTIEDQLLGFQV